MQRKGCNKSRINMPDGEQSHLRFVMDDEGRNGVAEAKRRAADGKVTRVRFQLGPGRILDGGDPKLCRLRRGPGPRPRLCLPGVLAFGHAAQHNRRFCRIPFPFLLILKPSYSHTCASGCVREAGRTVQKGNLMQQGTLPVGI